METITTVDHLRRPTFKADPQFVVAEATTIHTADVITLGRGRGHAAVRKTQEKDRVHYEYGWVNGERLVEIIEGDHEQPESYKGSEWKSAHDGFRATSGRLASVDEMRRDIESWAEGARRGIRNEALLAEIEAARAAFTALADAIA